MMKDILFGYKETPLFSKRGVQIVQNISNNVLTENLYYQYLIVFSASGSKYQPLLSVPLFFAHSLNFGYASSKALCSTACLVPAGTLIPQTKPFLLQ